MEQGFDLSINTNVNVKLTFILMVTLTSFVINLCLIS